MMKQKYAWLAVLLGSTILYQSYWMLQTLAAGFRFWEAFDIVIFNFSLLHNVCGVAGLLLAITSGFKKNGLLRMYMCTGIMVYIFSTWLSIEFVTKYSLHEIAETGYYPFTTLFFIHLMANQFRGLLCIAGLWMLRRQRTPLLVGGDITAAVQTAGNGKRLIHWLTDSMIVFFLVAGYLARLSFFRRQFSGDVVVYLAFAFTILLYYLVLEGVFNTTAGKAITGCTIVNEAGQRPGFLRVAGRTVARLIPFNPLSFIGRARGWHDRFSGTRVVEETDIETAARLREENRFDFETAQPGVKV